MLLSTFAQVRSIEITRVPPRGRACNVRELKDRRYLKLGFARIRSYKSMQGVHQSRTVSVSLPCLATISYTLHHLLTLTVIQQKDET